MRRLLASLLVTLSGSGNFALAQQSAVAPVTASEQDKPRIYVTDSNSWSTQSSAGGSHGSFGASSSGGARPQTAEIIKTFGQRCPQVVTNNRVDAANYVVELDHEGGKGLLTHKDKIAVFVQKSGDSIFSKSTLSVGGSVQDACTAILAHWGAHSSELTAVAVPVTESATSPNTHPDVIVSISVDASAPNCDIEVDGNFVGNTPSTINVPSGKHEIVVKKTGYQDWSRSMMVATGTVRLSAEMVAAK
jgi:PEGA domain-containing protein